MNRNIALISLMMLTASLAGQPKQAEGIPCQMEELTSPQFVKAVELSGGVCVIPLGIIEKHATHLPLGTDLYEARASVVMAAEKEYAVVFPPYYVGQIFEAKHQPGTIAYSNDLMWKMLEETSMMYYIRPDLVDTEAMGLESGLNQKRLDLMPHAFAGIHWYARYPNHFAGDVLQANRELGELLVSKDAYQLADLIKYLKSSNRVEELQNEFHNRAEDPLKLK